jgi:hypothetical protein
MPSYRPGGMDILFDALSKQTFNGSWEFLFPDEIFDQRHEALQKYLGKSYLKMDFKHIKAENYPYPCPASTSNTAIKVARGDLLVFIGDYSWFNKDFLQEHWDVFRRHENTTVAASYIDVVMPAMKDDPKIDDMSLFKEEWDSNKFLAQPIVHLDDRHRFVHNWIDAERGYIHENWIMGLISLPRETVIRLNGYNTIYNGGKGGSDYDLNFRATKIGHRFLYSRKATVCRCAHPHHKLVYPFTEKQHIRPRSANHRIQQGIFDDIHKRRRSVDGLFGLQDRTWKNSRIILINGGGSSAWVNKSIMPLLNHNLNVRAMFPGLDYSLTDFVVYGCSFGDAQMAEDILHKAQCWFWWTGTDVYNLIRHKWGLEPDHEFFKHPNLHHLAVHERLQTELKLVGIKSEVLLDVPDECPFPLDGLPPMPKKCRILCYVPSSRPEFYGLPTILEVAGRLPEVDFWIYGNKEEYKFDLPNVKSMGWFDNPYQIYKECSALFRPSLHEGIPYAAVEMMRMGRHFISNYPYEHAMFALNTEQMIDAIARIKDVIEPNLHVAKAIRELYNPTDYYRKFVKIFYGVEAND